MIRKFAVRWAGAMVKNGAPKDQEEVYIYALECSLNELASDLFLLVLAAVLGRVWEMVTWIVVFNILRLNVGGYHASTPLRCILLSTLLGVACTLIYPVLMGRNVLTIVLAVFCMAAVFAVAPVMNQRHPLSQQRQERAKKTARILSAVLTVGICGFSVMEFQRLSSLLAVSFCSVVMLSILAEVLQKCQAKSR